MNYQIIRFFFHKIRYIAYSQKCKVGPEIEQYETIWKKTSDDTDNKEILNTSNVTHGKQGRFEY